MKRAFRFKKYFENCGLMPSRLPVERFHSRDRSLCKFIGTKESVYIRKEFNSHRIGLEHQHGRRDVM